MANTVTWNIVAIDKFTSVVNNVSKKVSGITNKFKRFTNEVKSLGITWNDVSNKAMKFGHTMKWLSASVIAFGGYSLKAASDEQRLALSLQLLGMSADESKKRLGELYDIALRLPIIEPEQIMSGTKALINMGMGVDKAIDRIEMLGRISIGTEIPLETLVQTIGRMERQGFVGSRAIMALNKMGLDKELAKGYGVTVKEVLVAVAKKAIPASVAMDILSKKSAEYGNVIDGIDNTFNEQLGDTKLLLRLIIAELGQTINNILGMDNKTKSVNERLDEFRKKGTAFFEAHKFAIKFGLAIGALIVVLTPIAFILSGIAATLSFLATIAVAMSIPFGVFLAVVGSVVGYFVLLGAVFGVIYYKWDVFVKFFTKTFDYIAKKIDQIKSFGSSLAGTYYNLIGIEATNTNNANVDINLNGPKGTVRSVSTSSSSPRLNVGVNMAGAK